MEFLQEEASPVEEITATNNTRNVIAQKIANSDMMNNNVKSISAMEGVSQLKPIPTTASQAQRERELENQRQAAQAKLAREQAAEAKVAEERRKREAAAAEQARAAKEARELELRAAEARKAQQASQAAARAEQERRLAEQEQQNAVRATAEETRRVAAEEVTRSQQVVPSPTEQQRAERGVRTKVIRSFNPESEISSPGPQYLRLESNSFVNLLIHNHTNSGWAYGRVNDKDGWFPSACLGNLDIVTAKYEFTDPPEDSRPYLKLHIDDLCIVEHRFECGWWLGSTISKPEGVIGVKGYFPANFVQ
jgi:hypothetical protein